MAVTQYIGARYVPVFADPIEWTKTKQYEPLTIVTHEGNSYTSKQFVPVGIDISDPRFWVITGNYNAQVEQYRRETAGVKEQADATDALIPKTSFNSVNTVKKYIDDSISDVATVIPSDSFDSTNTVKKYIDTNASAIEDIQDAISYAFKNTDVITIFSDSTFQRNPDPTTGITQKAVYEYLSDFTDATIDNRGVGGTSTQWLLDLLDTYDATSLANSTYIIVAYGTNDWQGSYPVCTTANQAIPNSFEYKYDQVLTKLEALAPNAHVICVTMGYIHSTKASGITDGTTLVNRSGNLYKAYCEVIQRVANSHNTAVLRLDKLLGINENNYLTKMVVSGAQGTEHAGIFVHYAQDTNEKIAKLIANGYFALSMGGYEEPSIDITPISILLGVSSQNYNITYGNNYNAPNQSYIYVPSGKVLSIEYSAPDTRQTWLRLEANAINIYLDGTQIAYKNVSGPCVIPLTSDTQTHTITISGQDALPNASIYNLGIYIGMPSIYNLKSLTSRVYQVTTKVSKVNDANSIYYEQVNTILNNIIACRIKTKDNLDITLGANGVFPEELPISTMGGTMFTGTAVVNGVITPISFRLSNNLLYSNDSNIQNGAILKNVNMCGFFIR